MRAQSASWAGTLTQLHLFLLRSLLQKQLTLDACLKIYCLILHCVG